MLNQEQENLLKSRYVTNASFSVNEFSFKCDHGEWLVKKDGQHVDVFTFRYMDSQEFKETIHDIFNNTEKVTFN